MTEKPTFRVAAADLEARDLRLIEIVFRHSQYNKYAFRLVPWADSGIDIVISVQAPGTVPLRGAPLIDRAVPIGVIRQGGSDPTRGPYVLVLERLALQLLPVLNRAVESELLAPGGAPRTPSPTQGMPASALPDRPAPHNPAPPLQAAHVDGAAPQGRVAPEQGRGSSGDEPESAQPEAAHATASQGARDGEAPMDSGRPDVQPAQAPRVAGDAGGLGEVRESGSQTEPSPPERAPAGPWDTPSAVPTTRTTSNLVPFPGATVPRVPTLRVLVVDDSPTVRRQLQLALDRMGLACEAAANSTEALAAMRGAQFDLALVDIQMPDMDGYRLTREIKRAHGRSGLPVIILSSRSSPFDLARGALAGCDAYLTKPVPFRALEDAVRKQLRRSGLKDGSARTPPDPPVAPRAASALARLFRR